MQPNVNGNSQCCQGNWCTLLCANSGAKTTDMERFMSLLMGKRQRLVTCYSYKSVSLIQS